MRRSARRIGATGAVAALLAAAAVSTASFSGSTSGSGSVSAATGFTYSTVVASDSPWLWWRLGETAGIAVDSSGNSRSGTVSRTGVVRGTPGPNPSDASTAYSFDGTSGCITAAATHANPTTLTLEIWFRTTSPDGGPLIGFDGSTNVPSGTTTRDRQMYLTPGGQVGFGVRPSSNTSITSPASYNDGAWHLAQATLTPSATTLFVDGRQVATGTGGSATSTLNWHVGCFTVNTGFTGAPTTGYFEGDLDEAAVYTTALTADAVAKRWDSVESRSPLADTMQTMSPWAWWRLGESSGATTADASTNGRTLTHHTSGVTGEQSGVVRGSAASRYDGSAGCSVASASSANPTTFTVSAWFNTTATTGGPVVGFNDGNATTPSSGSTRDRHVYLTPSGTVVFGVLTGGTPSTVSSTDSGYNDGVWHHVVATLGAAGQMLYVDGVLQASSATTAAAPITGYWHVGCQTISSSWTGQPSSNWFNGRIDEVAVWTAQLDGTNAARLFRAAGAPRTYPAVVAASSPWLQWRLDDIGQQRYIADASGNGRSGLRSAGGLSRAAGLLPGDAAATLDGSSGCAVSTVSVNNPGPLSVEMWFRTTTTIGGTMIAFSDGTTPAVVSSVHDRNIYMANDGSLVFGVWTGSAPDAVQSSRAYNDGRWHHAVGTVGTTGTRLYVDGVLVGSTAATAGDNRTGYWRIGCTNIGPVWPGDPTSDFYAGDLDEVAVYASQLSPAAVRSHYRAGLTDGSLQAMRLASPVAAAWSMEETSGTTLADASGGARPLTASASGLTYSVPGVSGASTAITFNGSTGCAVDTASQNPPPTRLTVEAWIRTTTTTGGGIIGMSSSPNPDQTGATTTDRNLYVLDDGRLAFGASPGTGSTITAPVTVNDGVWHHVAASLGPGGLTLYVDGALSITTGTPGGSATGPLFWHVGCASLGGWPNAPSSQFFAGTIDEVTVHDQVLDRFTIARHAALVDQPSTTARASSALRTPGFSWRLEESSGNATDSSGNGVTGTASASGITRQTPGAISTGRGWMFNGSTGCLVSSSSYANPKPFTIEAWFRTESTNGGGLFGFSDDATATSGGNAWDRMVWMNNNGTIGVGIWNGGGAGIISLSTTVSYNDGQWHHVALSVGPAGSRLFLDGISTILSSSTTVENFTGYWHVGCGRYVGYGSPTSSYLNGWMDEINMYPLQLSAAAIKQRYMAGQHAQVHVVSGTSIASTILGTGTASSTGDNGPATSATVSDPRGVGIDHAGNVYVGENCRVRRITPNGVVTTFAGTGTCGSSGDGGAATSATIGTTTDVAFGPDGSVYLADADRHRIRKVSPAGIITTFAGNGNNTTSGNGGVATSAGVPTPWVIEFGPDGSLYIGTDNRVRVVGTDGIIRAFAGTGAASSTGDGGAATSATFNTIGGIAFEPSGALLVSEYDGCRIRRINTAGIVSTMAGTGSCTHSGDGGAATSAGLRRPDFMIVDPWGNVFVSMYGGHRVRRITTAGIITTVIGTGTAGSTGDGGQAASATVNGTWGLAVDGSGRIVVVENTGDRVRRFG